MTASLVVFPQAAAPVAVCGSVASFHLFHRWREIERIGRIVIYRCEKCPKGKIRVR